jgi:hypothetical protein
VTATNPIPPSLRPSTDPTCPRCQELDARIALLERQIATLELGDHNAKPTPLETPAEIPRAPESRNPASRVRRRVRLSAHEEERRRQRKKTWQAIIRISLWVIAFLGASYVVWWIILYTSPGGPPRN